MDSSQQKHHFIPRFILKKFAPEDQPPAAPAIPHDPKSGRRNRKSTARRDFLVNKVDLRKSELTQRPVSTEFALVDMYRDPGFNDNPYHLEKKLSSLEGQASDILQQGCKEFAKGSVLELERTAVDTLRKFLFLMKYRNTSMFDRYNHDHVDDYDANDRERMLGYMRSKGFSKPRDVWFDNLRHLLDLQMDTEKSWRDTLKTQIYPDDAIMFEAHLLNNFMAFCSPEVSEDEFLLTQNAYSIFEGPVDLLPGKTEAVQYTEYHNFAPVSPKLIIILRSLLLPPFPERCALRGLLAAAVRSKYPYPDQAGSILQDLPVSPCEPVYIRQVVTSLASFHSRDRFRFRCFKISPAHITTINNILLEEAHSTCSIVYHSSASLKSSVENFLTDGMKYVLDNPSDSQRFYLKKLEKILRHLGSTAKCKMGKFRLLSARISMSQHVADEVAIQLVRSEEMDGSLPRAYSLLKPGASDVIALHLPDTDSSTYRSEHRHISVRCQPG